MSVTKKKIKHLQQPTGSHLCGQYCVSMVTGKPITKLKEIMGSGKTRTKDLCNGLGIEKKRLKVVRDPNLVSMIGILKVVWKKGNGHWILTVDGQIYDPLNNMPVPFHVYLDWLKPLGKITSYLELKDIKDSK